MRTHRLVLALAALMVAGSTGDLRAQENTLPPIDGDSPNLEGKPRRVGIAPDRGPCFYNWMAVRSLSRLNNSDLGGEILEMNAGPASACSPTYGIHAAHAVGPWAYKFIDGQANWGREPWISPEKVKAARLAAFEAAGGDPTAPVGPVMPRDDRYRLEGIEPGHAPVPGIGDGYGSGELMAQTLRLRVAPSQGPRTYGGVPILEPGRSWVRVQRQDGSRTWHEVSARRASYANDGLGLRYTQRNRPGYAPTAESRAAYRNARMQSLSRSMDSDGGSRTAASSAPAPHSSTGLRSPRSAKVEQ